MLTNKLVLSKKNYQNFSYLVEIQSKEEKISIHGAKNYQHKVFFNGKNLQAANVNYSPLIEVGASWEVVAFVSQLYLPSSTASS